jgi:hypothetical protein
MRAEQARFRTRKVNLRTVIEARIDFGSVVPAHNVSVPFGHVAGCASSFH